MKYVATFQSDVPARVFHAMSDTREELEHLRRKMIKKWGREATGWRVQEVPDDWECTDSHDCNSGERIH